MTKKILRIAISSTMGGVLIALGGCGDSAPPALQGYVEGEYVPVVDPPCG